MVGAENQYDENQQVSQSFGVLRTVDCADAEGEKSGENAGDGRGGAGTWARGGDRGSRGWVDGLWIGGLWGHESRGGDGAIQTGGETRLAVDDSADVAGTSAAERLAAGAGKSDCGGIAVGGGGYN